LHKETFGHTIEPSQQQEPIMAVAIKLSDELVDDARVYAKAHHRTPPKQIEYWARIGKIAEENPDLPLSFVKDALVGLEELQAGQVSAYEFD